MFCRIELSQYLRYWAFPLRFSFQLILYWWTPNQRIKVDDATQMITEVYLDVQAVVSENYWTWPVLLTSLNTVSALVVDQSWPRDIHIFPLKCSLYNTLSIDQVSPSELYFTRYSRNYVLKIQFRNILMP